MPCCVCFEFIIQSGLTSVLFWLIIFCVNAPRTMELQEHQSFLFIHIFIFTWKLHDNYCISQNVDIWKHILQDYSFSTHLQIRIENWIEVEIEQDRRKKNSILVTRQLSERLNGSVSRNLFTRFSSVFIFVEFLQSTPLTFFLTYSLHFLTRVHWSDRFRFCFTNKI